VFQAEKSQTSNDIWIRWLKIGVLYPIEGSRIQVVRTSKD